MDHTISQIDESNVPQEPNTLDASYVARALVGALGPDCRKVDTHIPLMQRWTRIMEDRDEWVAVTLHDRHDGRRVVAFSHYDRRGIHRVEYDDRTGETVVSGTITSFMMNVIRMCLMEVLA